MILNILSYSITIEMKKTVVDPYKRKAEGYRIEKKLEEAKYKYLYQNL